VLVQVAYAIGVAKPVGFYVNTYGTSKVKMTDGKIANTIGSLPGVRYAPYFIEQRFALRTPIYSETASYGHMGRKSKVVTKTFNNAGQKATIRVKLFPWEELNALDVVKKAFKL
jgi:S-adenosylmethionine synthetase